MLFVLSLGTNKHLGYVILLPSCSWKKTRTAIWALYEKQNKKATILFNFLSILLKHPATFQSLASHSESPYNFPSICLTFILSLQCWAEKYSKKWSLKIPALTLRREEEWRKTTVRVSSPLNISATPTVSPHCCQALYEWHFLGFATL